MKQPVKLAIGFLVLVVVLCVAMLLLPKEQAVTAVIKQDGVVLHEIDLTQVEGTLAFPVEGENQCWNGIVAEKGRIRVIDASCPDQVCVNQGWIDDSSVPIVCLPNKLVIEISGGEAQFDAVTK